MGHMHSQKMVQRGPKAKGSAVRSRAAAESSCGISFAALVVPLMSNWIASRRPWNSFSIRLALGASFTTVQGPGHFHEVSKGIRDRAP